MKAPSSDIPEQPTMTDEERRQLLYKCSAVFCPATPINNRDLFAGRLQQIREISEAINTPGRHGVVFGERGVGKTSLAKIVSGIVKLNGPATAMVNCTGEDDFRTLWRRIFSEFSFEVPVRRAGMTAEPEIESRCILAEMPDSLDPGEVCQQLRKWSAQQEMVVIIDEFDRLYARGIDAAFADTIKCLSDNSAHVTIILVGVAQTVEYLIKEHASIGRCLAQVRMPRMTNSEIGEIIDKALSPSNLNMKIDANARDLIVLLSQGLPHYTHFLGQESAFSAINTKRRFITLDDVEAGIKKALEISKHYIGATYHKATNSPQKNAIFQHVLLACALANVDDLGYFSAADVREPLRRIAGKQYEIPNFSQHLDKFSDAKRGPVLEKVGTSHRFKFRFINPLLQPYILMKGIGDQLIQQEMLEVLQKKVTDINSESLFPLS